jgi:hypothetical protein
MKEKITIIKQHLNFDQLPLDIQKSYIETMADEMIQSFDKGVYNKRTATIDAKKYYYDWNKDVKWVLYKSSFYGFRTERQEDINNIYA